MPNNWKRLLVLVAFTAAIGAASFAAEDEVNAQTAGSAGSPPTTAGTNSGGSTSSAGSGTTTTSEEKKDDGGGCSVSAPASDAGLGALVGLALGLALWKRRRED